ncbi:uncharacterized protein LOC110812499 [Carica papaya]|uniref:uncharacterized protein LOC110812499 n=1 Tax=Carica papaya TaxID=3649 RepID=UPI000B8CCD23|nr:uncharacterized protein LOC110812499 [Carica papaya]
MDDSNLPPIGDTPALNQIKRYEEDKTKKLKAIACLFSTVLDKVFLRIMNFESPKAAWEKLKEEFNGGVRSRKIKILRLKSEFALLRIQKNESVKDFASKLLDVVNKMRLFGGGFSEIKGGRADSYQLTPKLEFKISALEELADIESISSAELINKLQSSEQQGKKVVRCNFCKRLGHKEKFCKQKQKQEGSQPKQELQHANVTEVSSEQCTTILVASSELSVEDDTLWVVDCGCTSHMCKDEALFVSLDKTVSGQVRLGNGMLETPLRAKNLLSVNQMTDRGYSVAFKDNCCRIYDPKDRLIAFIQKKDQAYSLKLRKVVKKASVTTVTEGEIWHKHLGIFMWLGYNNCRREA